MTYLALEVRTVECQPVRTDGALKMGWGVDEEVRM